MKTIHFSEIFGNLSNELLHLASQTVPHEWCGFLVRQSHGLVIVPCENIAYDLESCFEISSKDWLRAEDLGEICAVVHSHPSGSSYLSSMDRVAQLRSDLPWIVLGLGVIKTLNIFEPVPPLLGRVFDYGRFDCYELVRDAYHLCGFNLPDKHRQTLYEDANQERFVHELPKSAFERVHLEDIQAGDLIVTTFDGKASHLALYLGNSEMLHHSEGQLSCRATYNHYWQKLTHSIWRHDQFDVGQIEGVMNELGANHDNSIFTRSFA